MSEQARGDMLRESFSRSERGHENLWSLFLAVGRYSPSIVGRSCPFVWLSLIF